MNHFRTLLPLTLLALATGCANIAQGRDFDMAKAQTFTKGKTTRTEIVAALGEPTQTGMTGEGAYIEYMHQRTSANILTGFGVGAVEDKVKLCRFALDKNGVLRDFTCSQGTPDYSSLGK